MEKVSKNQFVFKGEIAEVLNHPPLVKARIICKPGSFILEVPSNNAYELGDEVLITGSFICEKIENINYFNTNH